MKMLVLLALVAGLVVAPTASAAKAPSRAEFNTLKRQVGQLQRGLENAYTELDQTKRALAETQRQLAVNTDFDVCSNVLTWDAISIFAEVVLGSALSRLDDAGACARVGITRTFAGRSLQSSSPFSALERLVAVQS